MGKVEDNIRPMGCSCLTGAELAAGGVIGESKPPKKALLYLSFPITGREAEERRAFAAEMIEQISRLMPWYEVVNPLDNKLEYDVHWSKHMKADIAMLIECDAIYMCKDWQWSHGCKLEHDIATSCGLDVYYHDSAWYAPIKK